MKRTLGITLLLSVVAAAGAQTSNTANKPAPASTVSVSAVPQKAGSKTAPANVKVTAAPVVKGSTAPAKPAVIAAKPSPAAAKPTVVAAKPAVVAAKPAQTPVAVKATLPAQKPVAAGKPAVVTAKPAVTNVKALPATVKPVPVNTGKSAPVAAPVAKVSAPGQKAAVVVPAKPAAPVKDPFNAKKTGPAAKAQPETGKKAEVATGTTVAVSESKPTEDDKKPEAKKIVAANRRDPFVSPVVSVGAVGSGCNSGKRCLAIDQIALRGIVKSDTGMIAVVVNAMDKAYFLRENDPVFNGYVVKITGDSIVFKETFHDRLGKPLTRDITKTISRPAA